MPLTAHGFRALHFLVANTIGRTNEWNRSPGETEEPMMDVHQVRDWLAAGHEIGSHTLTHPFLSRIPRDAARREILDSRKKLEDLFGRPVPHFCYPYGDFDPAVRDMVIEAGYQSACSTNFGVVAAGSDRFALERIMARHRTRNLKRIVEWFGVPTVRNHERTGAAQSGS
jgi:peptidoglycan/xylan/chitin deacetylase (PgdA/CDA1 family)